MPTTQPRRRPSRVVLGVLLMLVVGLLTGCLRYTESLTIATDDTVSGIIIIGARKQGSSGDAPMPTPEPGQQLPEPTSDSPNIVVVPFDHEQESGYKITFRDATFEEVSQFAPLGDKGGALELTRDGEEILISMTIDLTYAVPADQIEYHQDNAKATVQLTVPGTVTSSDGQVDGQQITWELEPLALNTLEARVESAHGDRTTETSRSIDPTRAAIIAAILVGLLLAGWLLGRGRLRTLLASDDAPGERHRPVRLTDSPPARPPRAERGPTPSAATTRHPASGVLDLPDPFGESAPPPPPPPRTPPDRPASRVPESSSAPSPAEPNAKGGWPPPRPRWKEEG